MKKQNAPLPSVTKKLSDIPISERVRKWRQGVVVGGTIVSGIAITALALLRWQRYKRSKSYNYAQKSFETLEVGTGVELHILFDTVSHTTLNLYYPNALRRRVKVEATSKSLSISRLPHHNHWIKGATILAELTLSSLSQLRVIGDARVTTIGCNKLESSFDLLQIGGHIEGLTVDATYIECQVRGNAKTNLYFVGDQSFIGYSGSPEMQVVLQSKGQTHITATGSGHTLLLGHTGQLSLTASDQSTIQADTLSVENVDVLLSDDATCQLNVADKLSYTLCNASKLFLIRQPKEVLQATILDSASLKVLEEKR